MKSVAAIVVAFSKDNYIYPCLDSLKAQTYKDLEVIVIDNSLNGDLRKKIREDYPNVLLLEPRENLFYGGALNQGIKASKGEFILCLNDDVTLDKDYITNALQGFERNGLIGMVSGKILRFDKITIDSTGLFPSYFLTARERGYGRKNTEKFSQEGFIFGVSGAAAFYRRRMLEQIKEGDNYFDPGLGMFYEDLDLAWRAERKGWRGFFVPGALSYHLRGASVRQPRGINKPMARNYLNDDLLLEFIKNRYLVIRKNLCLKGFLLHLPGLLVYEILNWSYLLIFRKNLIKKTFFRAKKFKK